jgi:hypothetical protein
MQLKESAKVFHLTIALAALGVPAAGQAPGSCAGRFAQTVTVVISSTGPQATVNPDRACVARGGTVNFTAKDGDTWAAEFASAAAAPFADGSTRRQGKVGTPGGGRVKACTTSSPSFNAAAGGCVFKFKAVHTRGNQRAEVDPDVTVEPGT